MIVVWKGAETDGVVTQISATMITVQTTSNAPQYYERVEITPAFPSFRSPDLLMYGTVTRLKERSANGDQSFIVRFSKIDERGNPGVFRDYVESIKRVG